MKSLVAYFSASGVTANVAKALADATGSDLFEIRPEKPYSKADLNWMNPIARCNREKIGGKDVPVQGKVENMDAYGLVYVGFPIWYGCAPNIVNTFLKAYDLSGKKIAAFATSGGSGIGKTADKLRPYVGGAEIIDAKLLQSVADVKAWTKSLLNKRDIDAQIDWFVNGQVGQERFSEDVLEYLENFSGRILT